MPSKNPRTQPLAADDVPIPGRRLAGLVHGVTRHRVLAVLAFLIVFPWIMPYKALAADILIYGLFAMGFNLIFGYTGMLSFGHAAFFGTGAYATGIAMVHFNVPWFAAMVLGLAIVAAVAASIGLLATRTRGIYFAMVTLALGQLVYYAVYQMAWLSGGENGLRGIEVSELSILGLPLNMLDPVNKYYFMLAFIGPAIWAFSRVLDSPFGAVLEAIRENENRARACGYNVAQTKWVALLLSGLFCGVAGSLSAIHLSVVPIESLHYHTSGLAVMMSLLGGMGTFFGPFIGAFVFLLLEDVITNITVHWQLFLGALVVLFVIFLPRGIWGTLLERLSR